MSLKKTNKQNQPALKSYSKHTVKRPNKPSSTENSKKLVLESKIENAGGIEIVIKLLVTSLHAYLFIALF